ncbi:hypothetical protein GUJ93_ZPchr0012g20573 [Zizania palustris]|uniref:Uncharacterized protein n=1 Tax=Zizania palustris TaxID=103762 RepID=A0A8J6BYX1_ZIZPA|nr:hypothetical protein GUJ93_ZPchr0012g20573 [Zizania palustris]
MPSPPPQSRSAAAAVEQIHRLTALLSLEGGDCSGSQRGRRLQREPAWVAAVAGANKGGGCSGEGRGRRLQPALNMALSP